MSSCAQREITDSELRMIVLRGMYELRERQGEGCYYQDFVDKVPIAAFSRICSQLGEKGLISWHSPAGALPGSGFGVITATGVDLIESAPVKQQPVDSNRQETTRAHCPNCGAEREALVLAFDEKKEVIPYDPDAPPICFYDTSKFLKCAGCNFTFLQKVSWNDDALDDFGRPYGSIEYFPKWAKEPVPEWILNASDSSEKHAPVFQKLREVLFAFESGSYWLACVGARSVLETAMIEKVTDKGTFSDKLDAYQSASHITATDKEQLKIVVEAGHAATHRSFHPTREQVRLAIEIVCRILQGVYIHAPQTDALKKSIPPRRQT